MDLPAEPQIRWILRTTAALLEHGAEPVRGLVQPTAEFFPDRFDGSPKAVAALMMRVQEHAGLADLSVELAVITPTPTPPDEGGPLGKPSSAPKPPGQAQAVSCSSGGCGGGIALDGKLERAARLGEGAYRVAISAGEVRHPTVLTTAFVRAASFMFLSEADALDAFPLRDREPAIDLAAALLGFGVIAANGSYIYAKGCGGVQVHSATRMPVDEVTLALAVFCKLHQVPDRVAARHLEVTPRAHFDEAAVWASSNAQLVRMLREDPGRIAADDYALGEARSWLARALGLGKRRSPARPEDELAELERSLPAAKAPAGAQRGDAARAGKLAEIRALVEESLEG
jgi:hypothetical protein